MKPLPILLLSLWACLPRLSFPQDAIKMGLIVLNNGDTLYGEIRSRNWSCTPQSLLFRSSGRQFSSYEVADICYFEAAGERYLRADAWIDQRSVDYELAYDWILPEHASGGERKTVWLKYLVMGTRYDLLEWRDPNKAHYFLRDTSGAIIPLEYKVSSKSGGKIAIQNTFRATLAELNSNGANDPVIAAAIHEASYDAAFLCPIVKALNLTTGDVLYEMPAKAPRKKWTFFTGIAGGPTVLRANPKFSIHTGTGTSAGWTGGFDYTIGYSKKGGQSLLRLELVLAQVSYGMDEKAWPFCRVKQHQLVPAIQLRLPLFTSQAFQAHVGGGFKTPVHLSEKPITHSQTTAGYKERFPWVAMTVSGHISILIHQNWEASLTVHQTPSIDCSSWYDQPIHYTIALAYRF